MTVEGLHVQFGGVVAIRDLSLAVHCGEIFGLIGPNGAGKTTLLNCLSRNYHPQSGVIHLLDRDISNAYPHQLARYGLSRTFQNLATFNTLSVLENVLVGSHHLDTANLLHHLLRLPSAIKTEATLTEKANYLLRRLGLAGHEADVVDTLPLALQRRVELARALAAEPSLLLLDEPAAGLSATEVDSLAALLRELKAEHRITLIVVEHNTRFIFDICDRVAVLNFGDLIACDTPAEIKTNQSVIRAYLGE